MEDIALRSRFRQGSAPCYPCSPLTLTTASAKHKMSLQVNLSSRELLTAYQDVINANGIDWALFTYDKGSNDLKVQSTGDGGLEELEEEFSDGR